MIISEIFDKLSINSIYLLKNKKIPINKKKEINFVKKELIKYFKNKNLSQDYIYYLCLITLINFRIWDYKEKMFVGQKPISKKNLKLSHQLNSIRNQIKNKILSIDNKKNDLIKTNTNKEDLKNWKIILNEKNLFSKSKRQKLTKYNLGESLDALTILQIKEIKFQDRQSKLNLLNFIKKNQFSLKNNQMEVLILFPFLAIINNFVWDLKDKINLDKNFYYKGLNQSQNLNSLRNIIKNKINNIYKYDKDLKTGIFYDQNFKDIIKGIQETLKVDLLKKDLEINKVEVKEFEKIFLTNGEKIKKDILKIFLEKDFSYSYAKKNEQEEIKLFILKKIFENKLWISGSKKKFVWERGWQQNLDMFKKNKSVNDLTPKFLGSKKYLRYKRSWIIPKNKNFEFDLIEVYRSHIFKKYFSNTKNIYEFGCGSAQHIVKLAQLFPKKNIFGLDWAKASIEIIKNLNNKKKMNVHGSLFDMFKPSHKIKIENSAAFLTIGALEQLGENFNAFLKYMLQKKPKIVVHFETIEELYDDNSLFDYFAKIYDKKRNYLAGYLIALKKLEKQKKIKIIRIKKVNFGSMMHDSYSTIAWRPI